MSLGIALRRENIAMNRSGPLDFSQFRFVTFDCYGTLIDWEAGIIGALQPVLRAHGRPLTDDEVLELYGELEPLAQSGDFMPYAEVLRQVMEGVAGRLGFDLVAGERDALVDSIGDWPAFPDTVDALSVLASRYRLWVLSNIDDALFARTAPRLGVDLDGVITAQQLRSYKPAPAHFSTLLERTGTSPQRVLHVAQSLFHDIAPARALGFTTVWVNRRGDRPGRGATPPSGARPDLEVPDLATLAGRVAADASAFEE
jgi:2-haloacid dehalogenase